jgi:purine catabolism regulator
MPLTVREALRLPAFRNSRARILAGERNLDRSVRWVHAAELPDIAPLLKGGELLLTTGMGIAGSGPTLRRRYIAQLAHIEVAGLIVELGRSFGSVPDEMVDAARSLDLPLIELGRETPFVDITEQVHRAIMSRQYELLDRVEEINRDFSKLVLGGAGIEQILRELAVVVGNPVVLENTAHQVIGYAPHDSGSIAPILERWEEHSRMGHGAAEPGLVYRASATEPACTWVGIWLRHEPWGRIHILESVRRDDPAIALVIDRISVSIGLAALAESDADHVADRAASAVISDLLQGRYRSTTELLQRAKSLGSDLSHQGLAAVIAEAANLRIVAQRQGLSEHDRQRVRLQLRSELRAAITRHHCTGLLGLEGDRVFAVLAAPDRGRVPAALEQIAESLRGSMAATFPGLTIVVGASPAPRPEALRRAFEEARIAADFGHHGGVRALYQFGNLGLYPLLLRLAQGPELAAFVESEIGGLLAHDATSGPKLLPTLRAYLAHTGHKADTVAALKIQRRTLYSRLDRITRILGHDLDNGDVRARLTVALQGRDVLTAQGAVQ